MAFLALAPFSNALPGRRSRSKPVVSPGSSYLRKPKKECQERVSFPRCDR